MNKIILAAALLAVSTAVSAQQQNSPTRPTVQSDNPSTRTNEGGSSYNDPKGGTKPMTPATPSTSNSTTNTTTPTTRATTTPATRATDTTTTDTTPMTPARRDRVARAPKADRN